MTDRKMDDSDIVAVKKTGKKKGLFVGGAICVLLGAGYFTVSSVASSRAEDRIRTFLHENRLDRRVQYKDISASVFGTVTLSKVRVDMGGGYTTINNVELSNIDIDDQTNIIESINIKLYDINTPIDSISGRNAIALGVTNLQGHIMIDYEYDPSRDHMSTMVNVSLPKIGEFESEVRLNRFQVPMMIRPENFDSLRGIDNLLKLFSQGQLEYASVSLEDKGLGDRIIDYKSAELGLAMPLSEYRQKLSDKFAQSSQYFPSQTEFQKESFSILGRVLSEGGGKLSIQFEPEYPVSLSEVGQSAMMLMWGGFSFNRDFQRKISDNADVLSDMMRQGVLKISYDD
ncbi:hypothetical protein TH25_19925 [Thalassospira profundimaris]|uniref:Uncharacterized protein n=1 Tax=Thalassospira profundimaris TaxID=502049 RepID=A0A367WSJ0_9PROT|nr:hypothetical protein [Thalassospira profundimaris]RCK44179.1 hypothetical protein TH25_19925 [Thalassospira profundimaris]